MPSRNNPNVPTSQKRKSSRSKVQKRNALSARPSISSSTSSSALQTHRGARKNPRGTAPSSVLYPTGGPAAPLSGKKARKVERAVAREKRRRAEEAMRMAGEVVMTDAPRTTKPKNAKTGAEGAGEVVVAAEGMDVDMNIS